MSRPYLKSYGTTTHSLRRIISFLNKQKTYVTKTKIVEEVGLMNHYIKEGVLFLEELGVVDIVTNNRTKLIALKDEYRY